MSETQVGSRRGRRELHSEDFPVQQPPEIDASDLSFDPATRNEVIVADASLTREVAKSTYLDELKFGEEYVTIMLYRGQEEFAPPFYTFSVNNKRVDIPVERPARVKRKYVEVIARSQPYKLRTRVIKPPEGSNSGAIQNLWHREQSARFPFTVIQDDNPRGAEWLRNIKSN